MTGPARIVHLLHALNGRTIAEVVGVVAGTMADRGYDVTVVSTVHRTSASELPAGVAHVDLHGSSRRTTTSVPALRRTLRRLRPAVIFAHGNGPTRAAALALAGMRPRPRLVGVEHNHYSSYPWNFRPARLVANRLLLPRADVVVGVSQGVVDDLGETFPALLGKLAVVPSPLTRYDELWRMADEPVDHPWFREQVPIVTTVGHVHPRKDHRTLVRAMARVRDVAGPEAARLAIIGDTDDAEAGAVQRSIEELGLQGCVQLLGSQPNPLRFVARSSVFALSSRNEGMGIAILEAMALGVPVVTTDAPSGPSWLLEAGRHGLLVPVGDSDALGDGILELLGDAHLQDRFRGSGQLRASAFTPRTIAQRYLEVAGLLESVAVERMRELPSTPRIRAVRWRRLA